MTESSENAPSNSINDNKSDFFDSLSKTFVVGAFATYIFGFLIVSVHNASYGFNENNPLKPKIAAAGLLFLVFLVVPIYASFRVFRYETPKDPRRRIAKVSIAALTYSVASFGFALAVIPLFIHTNLGVEPYKGWRSPSFETAITSCLLILSAMAFVYVLNLERTRPTRAAVLSGSLVAAIVAIEIFASYRSTVGVAALWFLALGIVSAALGPKVFEAHARKEFDWSGLLIPLVGALAIFPSDVYPKIKSSWGGGSPVPVVVYFSKDSRILPEQQMNAELVDESDAGIFVVRSNDSKALFIPRSAVAAVYFSVEPLSRDIVNTEPPKR